MSGNHAWRRTSDAGQRTSDGGKSKNNISTPQGGGHKKSWNQQEPYKTIVNEPDGNNGKWGNVLLTQCKVKMWPISSNKYIFHCFAQVSAIRKAKLITFSKTDSQILFLDFVVSSIMKQFTVYWNTVNNYINLNLSKGFYKKTWF